MTDDNLDRAQENVERGSANAAIAFALIDIAETLRSISRSSDYPI